MPITARIRRLAANSDRWTRTQALYRIVVGVGTNEDIDYDFLTLTEALVFLSSCEDGALWFEELAQFYEDGVTDAESTSGSIRIVKRGAALAVKIDFDFTVPNGARIDLTRSRAAHAPDDADAEHIDVRTEQSFLT